MPIDTPAELQAAFEAIRDSPDDPTGETAKYRRRHDHVPQDGLPEWTVTHDVGPAGIPATTCTSHDVYCAYCQRYRPATTIVSQTFWRRQGICEPCSEQPTGLFALLDKFFELWETVDDEADHPVIQECTTAPDQRGRSAQH